MQASDRNLPVFLASASPRRRELLDQIGVRWELVAVAVDESRHGDESPAAYVTRLARAKALAGRARLTRPAPVVAADTAVVCRGEIFGKPGDEREAHRMLEALSDTTHDVYTAVAVAADGEVLAALSRSEVTFRKLASNEISAYWRTGEPRDKAGAYAIQGRGAVFIAGLRGSYSGVMGLPVFETAELLARLGITPWDESRAG